MDQAIVNDIAREDTLVRCQDVKVELGREYCTRDSTWCVLPIPNQDVGMVCSLQ